MEYVEAARDVVVNMAFQYPQTRDTILSDAGCDVYAQPDRSPDTVVSMGMQYSRMGGYDVRGAPAVSRICIKLEAPTKAARPFHAIRLGAGDGRQQSV
ncbi:hypothetical protein JG687_00018123 [Phytophthora cactorum]|uniref:Uncharacterized protein n=1 Tax=Phytophthora cactorum TaxID=29920 RepID=A0A8T1TPN2_9STRA|nr:hypothetical protein JG687_00018123 [Phytophthora cactorum]